MFYQNFKLRFTALITQLILFALLLPFTSRSQDQAIECEFREDVLQVKPKPERYFSCDVSQNSNKGSVLFTLEVYRDAEVSLRLFDMEGNEITTILKKTFMHSGVYQFDFVTNRLAGTNFQLKATGTNQTDTVHFSIVKGMIFFPG